MEVVHARAHPDPENTVPCTARRGKGTGRRFLSARGGLPSVPAPGPARGFSEQPAAHRPQRERGTPGLVTPCSRETAACGDGPGPPCPPLVGTSLSAGSAERGLTGAAGPGCASITEVFPLCLRGILTAKRVELWAYQHDRFLRMNFTGQNAGLFTPNVTPEDFIYGERFILQLLKYSDSPTPTPNFLVRGLKFI